MPSQKDIAETILFFYSRLACHELSFFYNKNIPKTFEQNYLFILLHFYQFTNIIYFPVEY